MRWFLCVLFKMALLFRLSPWSLRRTIDAAPNSLLCMCECVCSFNKHNKKVTEWKCFFLYSALSSLLRYQHSFAAVEQHLHCDKLTGLQCGWEKWEPMRHLTGGSGGGDGGGFILSKVNSEQALWKRVAIIHHKKLLVQTVWGRMWSRHINYRREKNERRRWWRRRRRRRSKNHLMVPSTAGKDSGCCCCCCCCFCCILCLCCDGFTWSFTLCPVCHAKRKGKMFATITMNFTSPSCASSSSLPPLPLHLSLWD